jgi:hypothetical protein
MIRRFFKLSFLTALAVCVGSSFASPAGAAFGFKNLDVTFENQDGTVTSQAGAHPFATTTTYFFNTKSDPVLTEVVDGGSPKDLRGFQVPGLVGAPGAVPTCSTLDFMTKAPVYGGPSCPDASALGVTRAYLNGLGTVSSFRPDAVYNLVSPPGAAQKIGFWVVDVPVTILFRVNESPPYNVVASIDDVSTALPFAGTETTLWGTPADPAHDGERGRCEESAGILDSCPANIAVRPYLTMPRSCRGPLATTWSADPWSTPGVFSSISSATHDGEDPPTPQGMGGCERLGFGPSIVAQPTTKAASSPTGLDFSLNVEDEGLVNPAGIAQADIEKSVVTLPEGFSVNPSLAEGLVVCTEGDLARETASSEPGAGCPNASKIGNVSVESPLLDESVDGSLYIAKPYENPFGSLLALYIVIKNPTLGIKIVQPLKVESDPVTGQLTTIAEEMPELPFSHFQLHFREGARSPLASPPGCGSYKVEAELYPSSGGVPTRTSSAFQIISGSGGASCPTGGIPPFHPSLLAGTVNNAAGRFSPFDVRLSRNDSEQEITHFSIKLPPGVAGKLAGIPVCTDSQIARAEARTGPHGGREELEDPSCSSSSQVGRTLVGSGVGPSLAYAPGKVYLAGPYHGAPISFVSITSGLVGPYDIGTVVVRLAIRVNPETGEVFLDSTGSDPIPHIIKGIPVHLRDIRVYTDRPDFTYNPTSCAPTSTASTVLGSGLDFGSPADDNPIVLTDRFQAADCAALPFKPKLSFRLVGGHKRSQNPALHAHVAMHGFGEAAIRYAQVALPRSEFLDNAHIGTVCTRVQFREGSVSGEKCPPASIYGHVSATTPILDGPLEGPIYLRSSEHQLPDLVAALHHKEINISLVGRVDSVKGGGIRNTFEFVPDAPLTSADFTFFGRRKGLLENSTNLCVGRHLVTVRLKAHSGKESNYKTPLRAQCGKKKPSKRRASR